MLSEFNELWDDYKKIRAGFTAKEKEQRRAIKFQLSNSFYVKQKSNSNLKTKQVVVKNISNLNKKSTKRCLDYILRGSDEGFAINENGKKVLAGDVMKDWADDFGIKHNSRDSWHLIFSIDESQNHFNHSVLKKSVTKVMQSHFFGYKYAMVLHSHQNNPHIHVVLNKKNIFTDKKLHFKNKSDIKEFFDDARSAFADSLGIHGLSYENKNLAQRNLKNEFAKIKNKLEFGNDDAYLCKDKISQCYQKIQQNLKKENENLGYKLQTMHDDIKELDKKYDDTFWLFLQYKKKNNKKYYRLGRDLKRINLELKEKKKRLKAELKKASALRVKSTQISEAWMQNYKDSSRSLILLENFVYNLSRLNPRGKFQTKSEFETFKRANYALSVMKNNQNDKARVYFSDWLITSRMLGGKDSLFALNKRYGEMQKNIYLLKNSRLSDEVVVEFEKQLRENSDFLGELMKKRYEHVKSRIGSGKQSEFLKKEYEYGVKVLYSNSSKPRATGLDKSKSLGRYD